MNEVRRYILIFVFLGIAVAAGSIAYYEHSRVKVLRNEATWLRSEIRRVQKEAQSEKVGVNKLRAIVVKQKEDLDRLRLEVEQYNKRKKK
jgi:uncharacterized protein (UPF0335 family)